MSDKDKNSELSEPLIHSPETDIKDKNVNQKELHQARPVVWISLSIFVALIFAWGNIILSYLSKYGFRIQELESPSGTVTNLFTLIAISYYSKSNFINKDIEGQVVSRNRLDWLYQIFIKDYSPNEGLKPHLSIYWTRVFVLIFVAIVHVLQHWTFIISYQYATLANLNNGIVMTVLASKPVFSSVSFYFLFKQRLERFELIGVVFLLCSVVMIGVSSEGQEVNGDPNSTIYVVISILLLFLSSALVATRTVVMKYFLAYDSNQVNVSAFYNFYSFCQNFVMLIVFSVDMSLGFTFEIIEVILAQITGILWSICAFIIAYVNLRGKAGTSDALIETCVVYQTIMDAIVFGRIPNTMQIISIFVGLIASVIIVLGYRKAMQNSSS